MALFSFDFDPFGLFFTKLIVTQRGRTFPFFPNSFLSFLLNLRKNSQFPILTKLFNMTMIRKMKRCVDFASTQWGEICDIERKR